MTGRGSTQQLIEQYPKYFQTQESLLEATKAGRFLLRINTVIIIKNAEKNYASAAASC